jgi:Holliday junction resolvase RusA-like endonuclease
MGLLEFTVLGTPLAQGSLRAVPVAGHARIINDNPRSKPWRADIQAAAQDARHSAHLAGLLDGPVSVTVTFTFARPKGHWGKGRFAYRILPSAPNQHVKRPDLDKLARAVLDALKGQVWRDDSQVIALQLLKRYGDPERADIQIRW